MSNLTASDLRASELTGTVHDGSAADAEPRVEPEASSQMALWLGGGIAVALVAATVAMWAHLGTAVFFEMVRAGFVACFG